VDVTPLVPWPTPPAPYAAGDKVDAATEAVRATYNAALDRLYAAVISPDWKTPLVGHRPPAPTSKHVAEHTRQRLASIAAVVALWVDATAPSAPQAAKDEALIRGVGYLHSVERAGWGAVQAFDDEAKGDEFNPASKLSVTLSSPGASAWKLRSGAASAIRPWTRRRAGAVG